ncbi:hypothetical protein [Haladaptatus sp. NG-WS-4]
MSKTNSTPLSAVYTQKWEESLDQSDSYYVPEKYQLGIVADYLTTHDVTYTTEGEVFCYPIDVLGVKRNSTIAIELKSRNTNRGIEQAQRNSDFVDYSFLSVWDSRVTEQLLNRVMPLDIGLIGIGEAVHVYSSPRKTDKLLCSRENVINVVTDDVRSDPSI